MSPDSREPVTVPLDLGDEAAARDRVGVVGANAQRIGEIAERLERDAVGRPALELVGSVGDQEMPALLVEGGKRGPALARVVGADQRLADDSGGSRRARSSRPARPARPFMRLGADEIEPIARRGAAPRLARTPPSRARPPPPSAPADARAACSMAARRPRPAPGRSARAECRPRSTNSSRTKSTSPTGRISSVLSVPTTRTPKRCARMSAVAASTSGIVVRIVALAARAPAIGEHVGVEQIGRARCACRHGRPSPAPDRSASAWRSCPRPTGRNRPLPGSGSTASAGMPISAPVADGCARRAALDDRLGEDGEADEGVDHHQRGQRDLRAQRGAAGVEHLASPCRCAR